MNQQFYTLTRNDTPLERNWTMLGDTETEDTNDPPTPGLTIGNSNELLRLSLLRLTVI